MYTIQKIHENSHELKVVHYVMSGVGGAGHWTYSGDVLDKCRTSGRKIHIPENFGIFIDMEIFLFYSWYKNSGNTFMEPITAHENPKPIRLR